MPCRTKTIENSLRASMLSCRGHPPTVELSLNRGNRSTRFALGWARPEDSCSKFAAVVVCELAFRWNSSGWQRHPLAQQNTLLYGMLRCSETCVTTNTFSRQGVA